LTSTSATYAAPTTGTAASLSITATGTHRVLVTLTVNCFNTSNDSGCFMGFDATGGLVQSASDNFAVGNGRSPGPSPDRTISQSASYLVTVTGNTTFTAKYRRAAGGTATFASSNIIVQVY